MQTGSVYISHVIHVSTPSSSTRARGKLRRIVNDCDDIRQENWCDHVMTACTCWTVNVTVTVGLAKTRFSWNLALSDVTRSWRDVCLYSNTSFHTHTHTHTSAILIAFQVFLAQWPTKCQHAQQHNNNCFTALCPGVIHAWALCAYACVLEGPIQLLSSFPFLSFLLHRARIVY